MKTVEDSIELAKKMTAIGKAAGRHTAALITNMDTPLGENIGNILEVQESLEVLKGRGPADLKEVCMALASNMLYLAGQGSMEECLKKAQSVIDDGTALEKFADMVEVQGGDRRYVYDTELFAKAPVSREIRAQKSGYLVHMDTQECGIVSSMLGAGRERVDSVIDYTAGIRVLKKTGDRVEAGETIAVFYTSREELLEEAQRRYQHAIVIGEEKAGEEQLVLARVEDGQIEWYGKK